MRVRPKAKEVTDGPEPDQEEPMAAVGETTPEPEGQENGQAGASEAGEGHRKD